MRSWVVGAMEQNVQCKLSYVPQKRGYRRNETKKHQQQPVICMTTIEY